MEQGTARTRLQDEPEDRFVRLRAELGVSSFGLNQITLRPGQRGRIHRHEQQEEVYVVLDGTLSLVVEGEETTVGPGDVVRVGPDVRRQLVNRGPETVRLLAIGGAGEHEGRDGLAYASWETTDAVSPRDMPLPEDLPPDERRG
jgi:uncharacterized cupin superfamily protein